MEFQARFWNCLGSTLLAFALALEVAGAQDQATEPTSAAFDPPTMTVGGHAFSPTSFMPDPFIRTFVRNSLGFGISPEFDIPPFEVGGREYSLKSGQLVYALLEFEFQAALRPWLAFGAQITVNGRLATETLSLLSQGVVLINGYRLRALFDVARTKNLTIAVSAGAGNGGLVDISLARFITAFVDSGAITPENELVSSTPSVYTFSEIRLAYGVNDLLGFLFTGELAYGEDPADRRSDRWFVSLAALADFNMKRRWGAPIGFSLGARTKTNPTGREEAGQNVVSFLARVSYVGSRDFDLGVDLSYDIVPIATLPQKVKFISAVVDMRLIF
jgi:hypothetical protein